MVRRVGGSLKARLRVHSSLWKVGAKAQKTKEQAKKIKEESANIKEQFRFRSVSHSLRIHSHLEKAKEIF